jgi:TP901 family phage tail tape measure protein
MPNLIEIIISGKNEAKAAMADAKADSEGLSSTMTKMGAVSGLALVAIAGESVKMASEFQSSTTRLMTSAGETNANIDMVRKGMLDMASQVGFSAIELSKGMYTIESAGFHGADGLTVLKAAAQGAKDENADLGKVANAVTDVLTDYHMKAADAAAVTSQMVTAVGFGKTTFDDFSGSMHNILPLASAMHLSFADVSGVLAEMTAHGMSADQASQNMANAMRSLIAPTGAQTKEFTALGISAQDVRDKLSTVGLSGTMEFLAETAKKVGPNVLDQEAALKKLMGTAPGLSVALMTTGENFDATTAAIKGISSATQDAGGNVKGFAEMQQTLGQKVAELKAGFDTLMIELGNKLIPVIASVVDWMNKHHDVIVVVLAAVGLLAAATTAYWVAAKLAAVATAVWEGAQKAYAVATAAATGATEAMSLAMKAIPVVAAAAGIAYLSDMLGHLAGVGDHTGQSVTDLTTKLQDMGRGSTGSSQHMADLAVQLAVMGQKLHEVDSGNSVAVQGMKDLDAATAKLATSGHADQAAASFGVIQQALEKQGFSIGYINDQLFPAYSKALADNATQQRLTGKSADSLAGATDGVAASQDKATLVQDNLTSSVAAATTEYNNAQKAAKGYADTIDALYGKYGTYSDSQAKLTLAMAAATKQITAGKDAVNLNTEAGAKNFQTLEGLATANLDLAKNMINTGSSSDQATTALRNGAIAIDNLATKSGFTKTQIQQLNTELYGVPNVKDIKISADVTSALNSVAELAKSISNAANSMGGIAIKGTTIRAGFAHGGEVSAAATGGDRSGMVLVGEEGPELVRLPRGSTVRSNPDTMGDLAHGGGRGGGGQQIELVLSGADQEFLTFLRKIIRVRQGNNPNSVQLALGQSF